MLIQPPDEMKRGPKWLQNILNGIRGYVMSSQITDVIVRPQISPDEPIGATIKPTPKGTIVTIVVCG